MPHIFVFCFLLCLLHDSTYAQVSIIPQNATTDDSVTVVYDAKLGNAALANAAPPIYMHTGLITDKSLNLRDWKYVASAWGNNSPKFLMQPLGNGLYSRKIHVRSFYNVPNTENVLQLAFVFRNASGSLVGRAANNDDLYAPINVRYLGDYESHTFSGGILRINTQTQQIVFSFKNHNILRVSLLPLSQLPDTSYAVVMQGQLASPSLQDTAERLVFASDSAEVRIFKSPLRYEVYYRQALTVSSLPSIHGATSTTLRFAVSNNEAFYGGGSRALSVNRRGQRLVMYNAAQYGYSNGAAQLNICVPVLVSSHNYLLFFDHLRSATADIAQSQANILSYEAQDLQPDAYIIVGNMPAQLLDNYTLLTGRQPLPPLWTMGYFQSKYGYQSQGEAENIVKSLREADYPLDALVLDLYWFGKERDMGNLDWDRTNWANPEKMMADFKREGVKTILITETYFTKNSINFATAANNGYLGKNTNGTPLEMGNFWAGNAGLLDITNPHAQDWFWNYYESRIREGVAGWWTDLGEPELHPETMQHQLGDARTVHNLYNLMWAELLHRKYRQRFPQTRVFNLTRSGWAGMQRYGTFTWSGDIQRSFSGLQAQIPIMLGMSYSGFGYMHSDLGGFVGGGQNAALYTRWMQLGAFSPVMRAHGAGGVPPEPIFYDQSTQNIVRQYIKLRYAFLPYNYTLCYENSRKGLPLARPSNFYEPNNTALQNINTQFLWGENVLVAPVLEDNQNTKTVIFPQGKWLSYWNESQSYTSGTAQVSAPIGVMPLFVRAGAFIPHSTPIHSTDFYRSDSIVVNYYPDMAVPQSQYVWFDDDKTSTDNLALQQFDLIQFAGQAKPDTSLTIGITPQQLRAQSPNRYLTFSIKNYTLRRNFEVMYQQQKLHRFNTTQQLQAAQEGYVWNTHTKELLVKIFWTKTQNSLSITPIDAPDEPLHAEEVLAADINLSPNPAQEYVVLNSQKPIFEGAEIYLYDMQGRLWQVQRNESPMLLQRLSVASLLPGVYQLVVHLPNGSKAQKRLVLQK